jgi:DNA/RNA endonuclease G (NUC1)
MMVNRFWLLSIIVLGSFTSVSQGSKTIKTDIFEIIYSEEYQQPLSVEYEVQCPEGKASRKGMNFYRVDSVLTSNNADYRGNVWDKGHMVPAAAFNCNVETLKETFSYLNCALQHQGLNRGPWKELEAFERNLAKVHSLVVVLITIHFDPEFGLLPTGARVPTGFTKEIFTGSMNSILFYFPNEDVAGIDWEEFQID